MSITDRTVFDTHIETAEDFIRMAEEHLGKSELMSTKKFKGHHYSIVQHYINHAKAQLVMARLYVVEDKPLEFKGFDVF